MSCFFRVCACGVSLVLLSPVELFASDYPTPLGLPQLRSATATTAQIALGNKIFFDKRLSANGTVSCANCHQPDKAFTDGRVVAEGINGQSGTRNTPTLLNAGQLENFFWDGRRSNLEGLVLDPFVNSVEHGLNNHDELVTRIASDRGYREAFTKAYGDESKTIDKQQVAEAIASYVRTLRAGNTPFDRYYFGGDKRALTVSAIRGLELFRGRAQCTACHTIGTNEALFTDEKFHNRGIGLDAVRHRLPELTSQTVNAPPSDIDGRVLRDRGTAELGRFLVTRDTRDIGRFRTPSLRNVAVTAPYMHDGSVRTLDEAVEREVYYHGIETNQPLVITPRERTDLVEFLRSLTSTPPKKVVPDAARTLP